MAFNNFVPKIWNAQLRLDFAEAVTAAAIVNREFEGDAKTGNQVQVTTAVDIAIKDYKAAGRTTSPDSIDVAKVDVLIDQEKNYDFLVDDIDRRQAAGSLDVYTQSAARGLAIDADKYILSVAAAGAQTNLSTGTPADGDDAFDVIRDLRKALNKLSVPAAQRVVWVNAEFAALLVGADSKLTSVDTSGDPAGLRDGTLGRLLGARVIETENLPVVSTPAAIMAYAPSIAFVSQLTKTEAMRDTSAFADRIRGLHVYGAKVTIPKGVATFGMSGASSSAAASSSSAASSSAA